MHTIFCTNISTLMNDSAILLQKMVCIGTRSIIYKKISTYDKFIIYWHLTVEIAEHEGVIVKSYGS